MANRHLDIGARKPVNGYHLFLVGRVSSPTDSLFVLLYHADKRRRIKRNIRKIDALRVVAAPGTVRIARPL
jgi:hypothetical protein